MLRYAAVSALALLAAGCDDDPIIIGGDPPGAPRDLAARFEWVFEGFTGTGQPVGHPVAELTWLPPSDWDEEPFRVYGKRTSSTNFFLIATVTSCTVEGCVYRDANVAPGVSYEYYVATVNEATNEETTSEFREEVFIPNANVPAAPVADSAVGLDNAAYVRWTDGGNGENLAKFRVFLTRIDGTAYLYQAGETDATGFLDLRAENGHRYGYRVAAVDTMGHVGALSAEMIAVPRPDRTAELVYAHADDPTQSGFRFASDESANPILAGTSAQAQWRLETDGSGWRIVPLNGTQVVEFPGRTTALVCGPGADADCRAASVAPTTGYQTTPIAVSPEFSYVFRVTGSDGQPHYGVVRVTLLGEDQDGNDLMIFDWAYQLVANEPRLDRRQ
jgi:hypothetical protein